MLLGVEEVRRLQVAGEVLVVHDDARDLGGALEAAVVGERRPISSNVPRNVITPLCLTAKLTLEWTGSRFHVPVGIWVDCAVVLIALPWFDVHLLVHATIEDKT